MRPPSESTMVDDLQKRKNTDCVYFLASPFTCKKGSDCEYRHNESARLNSINCRYWLSGNCLKQNCTFRHPPYDAWTEAFPGHIDSYKSDHLSNAKIPCYFYYSGSCKRGEGCHFSHNSVKGSKVSTTVSDALPVDNKTSSGSYMELGSVEVSENLPKRRKFSRTIQGPFQPDGALEAKATNPIVINNNHSPVNSVPGLYSPQSEEYDAASKPREPSPGFEMLIDDRIDKTSYEDGPECSPIYSIKENERRLSGSSLQDDVEDSAAYGQMVYCTSPKVLNKHQVLCGSRECLRKNKFPLDHVWRAYDNEKYKILESKRTFSEMKLLPRKVEDAGYYDGATLRSDLSKRRKIDNGFFPSHISRRDSLSCIGLWRRDHVYPTARDYVCQPFHRTFGSDMRRNTSSIRMLGKRSSWMMSRSHNSERVRHSFRCSNIRTRSKERKDRAIKKKTKNVISSRIIRGSKPMQDSTTFVQPKMVAEIKEGKRRRKALKDEKENGNLGKTVPALGRLWGLGSEDFEGPKPLSELLKNKKKLDIVS